MRRGNMLLVLLLGLAQSACGNGEKVARLATFNVGLAPGYEQYVEARKPMVQAALAEAARDLDVLCVQEYWSEGHWQDLVAATASELPNALRRPAEPGPASCTPTELDPLMGCLRAACAGLIGDDLVTCAVAKCAAQVASLSSACVSCATQDLTIPLDQIYAACTSGVAPGTEDDTPALYGGVFDVGLLSRHPFLATDSKRLDAFMVRVAVLYAKVATEAGEVNVFCTHLNSDIGDWDYGGTHASWREENAFEAQQLVAYVDEKAQGGAAVILGDLNTAVAKGTMAAAWPECLGVLTGAGFADPYLAQGDASCTLCPDNPQRSATSSPKLVDHALIKGFTGKATVERAFTANVIVQVEGAPVRTSLSDHYGLIMKLVR